MPARIMVEVDSKEPEKPGPPFDDNTGAKARLKSANPWKSLEFDSALLKWQLAASETANAAAEVSPAAAGGMTDNVALVQMNEAGDFRIQQAGQTFETWIGCRANQLTAAELSIDRARALRELFNEVLRTQRPAQTVAYGVVGGLVYVYDLVAVPLAAGQESDSSCLVYLHKRQQNFSLVEAMFQATGEGLVALAVIRDAAGAPCDFLIAALNEGAAGLLRGPAEDLRGRRLSEICALSAMGELKTRITEGFNRGGSERFEIDFPRASGGDISLSVSIATTGDLVALTLTDISDLKAREESFRLLFEGNPVPMFLCATESLAFLAVNEAATEHYGYDHEAFLTLALPDILPEEDRDKIRDAIGDMSEGPSHPWQHVKADGTRIDVLTYRRTTVFQGRRAELIAVIDVTEKRRAETRIAYMAEHDTLTGLPNRMLFLSRLNEALLRLRRHGEHLAVLYLDLDHFKNVNDTLGHPAGDGLLKNVAERLCMCLRETDSVARFGGDEFAILQTGLAGAPEAGAFADRIVKLLSEPYDIDEQQIVIGASVGIALAPNDGDTAEELLKNADMALYRAKEDGRRVYRYFEPGMDARLRARRALELDLRTALTEGQFELHYQPLVTLESGAVSGFEALLRWRHPQRGMVPPLEFIPLAEEIGLIVPLGEWVLRQACADAATWPSEVKIAVNLSPVQFKKGNVVDLILTALTRAGLPANRLDVEITESILFEESNTNLATLRKLHALGISISMDDFGTGYSGMSYLRAFPFDKIKIDRSFVSELGEKDDCMAIVRAITRLGASLGIRTTAEGVETATQIEMLRSAGCTEMQGYFLSRPMPATHVPAFLASFKTRWPIAHRDYGGAAHDHNAAAVA
ncbi:MAG TPA: EAL domain-containing protein [Methylocella sp.]|nr:EAL domain-containing protein [Methylocella sp.]